MPCCIQVTDGTEVGWEECTEAAMTNLLRTALAKNAKEAAAPLPPLAPIKDTGKLKKHMSLVLERMAHGMKLIKPDKPEKGRTNGIVGGGDAEPAQLYSS